MSMRVDKITFAAMLLVVVICLVAYFVNDKLKPLCDWLLRFGPIAAVLLLSCRRETTISAN